MVAKLLELKSIAALTIMMFFYINVPLVYAEMPTEDPLKTSENGETAAKENNQSETEDEKKEDLDKAQKDRGYGPLNSLDLYMDVINTVEGWITGDRFGDNLKKMKEKYKNAFKKEIELKIKKEKAKQARKKQTETLLREEFEKQKAAVKTTLKKREEEDTKKGAGWVKAYNWYKSSKSGEQQSGGAGAGE